MKKLLTLLATISCLLLLNQNSYAQRRDETPLFRYEVGGHIFGTGSSTLGDGFGVGGRFTYNFNRHLAADNELDSFLSDEAEHVGTQGLFGLKAGGRYKQVGVFAKARAGFISNIALNGGFAGQTKPAFDVGGVLEVYPVEYVALRVDVGDTIVPLGRDTVRAGFPDAARGTTHSLQISLGLQIRF